MRPGIRNPNKRKAQSAMEYLMTYGWAILIVAVVIAALFALGLFNGGAATPSVCIAQPGYTCTNPSYSNNGISATLGQQTGQYYYGAWVFIASENESLSASGLPESFATSSTSNMLSLGALAPEQTRSFVFSNVIAGDIPLGAVSAQFNGYVWLAYCTTFSSWS